MKTEYRIQQDLVVWYRNTYCLAHHAPRCIILAIPNEGNPRLVQTGTLPGTSDLIAIHRNTVDGKAILAFVEVKTETGRQSPKQRAFQLQVEEMGFNYYIVRSLDEFKAIVETWKNQ